MTEQREHHGELPEDVAERMDNHDLFIEASVIPPEDSEELVMAVNFGHKEEPIKQGVGLTHDQVVMLHYRFTQYLEAVGSEDYEVTEHVVRPDDRGIQ